MTGGQGLGPIAALLARADGDGSYALRLGDGSQAILDDHAATGDA